MKIMTLENCPFEGLSNYQKGRQLVETKVQIERRLYIDQKKKNLIKEEFLKGFEFSK